ncbi:MAG TPA: hypothetical protein VN577_24145 [Terriglobales bacterium]|nr:hypothetical protein [Terriglobales bacterium]
MGKLFCLCAFFCLLTRLSAQVHYPWVIPGDFKQRIESSDLVLSGTVVSISPMGGEDVDGIELRAQRTQIKDDRLYKGQFVRMLTFKWYTGAIRTEGGIVGSGPPHANFQNGFRYLVFLRRVRDTWQVTLPLVSLEVELGPFRPGDITDLSGATPEFRNRQIAEELQRKALSLPEPPPGTTGLGPWYAGYVRDLIGRDVEPLLRHLEKSRIGELRREARRQLRILSVDTK